MPNDGGLCQSSGSAKAHQFIPASHRSRRIDAGQRLLSMASTAAMSPRSSLAFHSDRAAAPQTERRPQAAFD